MLLETARIEGQKSVRLAEPLTTPARRKLSAFWPAVWLAFALFCIKAIYVPLLDDVQRDTFPHWVRAVLIMTASDVLYAAAAGLTAQALLFFTRRREALQRALWIGFVAFCVVSVTWGVLSLRFAQILRMPLTYQLFYLSGDLKSMQSSVSTSLPVRVVAAIVGAPLLYLALVLLTQRLEPFGRTARRRVAQAIILIPIIPWYCWSRAQVDGYWGRQEDGRGLAGNPHYTLVSSFLAATFGRSSATLDEQFPPEYLDDFKIAGERSGSAQPTPGLARGPRNVIVVIGESICAQHLSLYGSKFKTWPRMQAEAANALVFDNYYSHITNTANALVSLTLSIYPPMSWREFTVERPDLPGTTVAQVLKPLGYRTAFISAGDNDFSGQGTFLKNRGYDVVRDAKAMGETFVSSWGVEDSVMVDEVLKFIDRKRGKPFYVFAWTQGTHHPYEPGPDWEQRDFFEDDGGYGEMGWELERYLNALYEADKQLERMLAGLRARGLADDTIVLITGDHGQAFGKPHKTYFHSGRVYQEDVNVPLMIWNPKLFQGGTRSEVIGAHVDLSPTVLDLLGIASPPSWQGRSLFDPLRPGRAYFYGAMDNYILGVRDGNFKYIFNATRGREELYDLPGDRDEQHNLADARPDLCKNMRQRLAAWVEYQKRYIAPGK
jgi:arylsulfatase A-like enzyme